jgi:hypothetical protein
MSTWRSRGLPPVPKPVAPLKKVRPHARQMELPGLPSTLVRPPGDYVRR